MVANVIGKINDSNCHHGNKTILCVLIEYILNKAAEKSELS